MQFIDDAEFQINIDLDQGARIASLIWRDMQFTLPFRGTPVNYGWYGMGPWAGRVRDGYPRLMSRITNSRITAPITAVMIDPIQPPPREMCSTPASHPPMNAPTMPTMMSTIRPKPPPLTSMPASQPATAPITSQAIKPCAPMFLLQRMCVSTCAAA